MKKNVKKIYNKILEERNKLVPKHLMLTQNINKNDEEKYFHDWVEKVIKKLK